MLESAAILVEIGMLEREALEDLRRYLAGG